MKQGVVIIAHGSRRSEWNELVEKTATQLDSSVPIEVAFLGMVEGKSIADSIRKLEEKGVQRIVAIPLFISSGSTHLSEIRYMLGITDTCAVPTDLERITLRPGTTIIWAAPMDAHPCIRTLLRKRVCELSVRPEEEALLLVAHGSEEPGYQEQWEGLLQELAISLRDEVGLRAATYGTFHPDNVRQQAYRLAEKYQPLVIPLFLSSGYYTETAIPQRLAGIPVRYDGRAYLPDPNVTKWLNITIKTYIS
ncbi:sirohydrochlorin ferrochelatase [Aneurinibacillus soli]|uniref:Sirohydrochlorin cobaltochelatase n=1 Tax=Aneurinibacillus soli TaxID=1500254 RepID=A0A0U5B1G7_9BACL|nr:CbiX/SirB N-terminal domain-containing protein [Aneurinibacillus soli]PYE60647.1 sirohydrochlorin ferrochelatase [Aneurinibacillus soli]BAU29829.1 sirohydrochlorin cobaltochelatase [Aneurinibacillus soli]